MSLKAISLFSGVGGLDFGFEAAGFETRVALDLDPVACATMRLNRNWAVLEGPISAIPTKTILDTAGLQAGEVDVLIGGPPCQPFSKSGYWARGDASRLNDPRADTLGQYLRVLEDTLPKAFLIENVPGLAYRGKAEGIEAIRAGVSAINKKAGTNYSFEFKVLNAASYGVPQMRERVFIVGARDGTRFEFPNPTHGEPSSGLEPFRTAWDAFADLPRPADLESLKVQGKWADLLPSIPEGNNYLWHTERGGGQPLFGWRRRYWNFLLKLAKNKPAWTIQAQPGPATGPFHWENRRLSTRELCRLQTFPDFLRFDCTRADVQRLVGNAVPSALAEMLALEITRQFFVRNIPRSSASLLPCGQVHVPAAATPAPVEAKFLHLLGSDSEHPGTGLGRSASNRAAAAV
ncbi:MULTISPECIES: DNA cytosine methyltransferase [unclassified Rhizobium]|uniref:DNA cytosine methyltransferase n=1 Tax=unclassified Rhizobium TaxID=2613769 RepID=UPI000BD278A0|nr:MULTISPECIES: DNA cytosine methyltransferase [unclassified Rhizobium]MDH7806853.1 DNA (cytosine-5)-methyltransferase 1 [Rhizobium sp. AN67]SOD57687.1 DNA (cytosine-5)-methyltransferase 1 [Rhizobium sp. AN6A]